MKSIGRAYTKIREALQGIGSVTADEQFSDEKFVARVATALALAPEVAGASLELTKRSRELVGETLRGMDPRSRPQPAAFGAAGVWLAQQLHGGVRGGLLADLSRASNIADSAIERAAQLMFPHVRQLVVDMPSDFRREDGIRRIEARYPIDASTSSILERKLDTMCTEMGLAADITSLAQQLLTAMQVKDSAVNRAAHFDNLKRNAVAATAAWLALQLKSNGSASAEAGSKAFIDHGVNGDYLLEAARAIFPHARALVAALPAAASVDSAALAALEQEFPPPAAAPCAA